MIMPYIDQPIGPILSLYNAATARVPTGFPALEGEFASWLTGRSSRLDVERTVLAMEGDVVRGLVRYCRGGPEAKPDRWYTVEPGDGAIACLWTAPGDVQTALSLVDSALDDLAGLDCRRIWAFEDELGPRFYNGGFGALSVTMSEVARALAMRGFAVHSSEFHMIRDSLSDIPRPEEKACKVAFGVTTSRTHTGEWAIEAALRDGSPVGQCVWAPMSSHSQHPEARRFGYVWWIGIDEPFRGMGAGRRLLLVALTQMRDNGLRAAVLTTAADNRRAQTLYLSEGFRVTDVSIMLVRSSRDGGSAEQQARGPR